MEALWDAVNSLMDVPVEQVTDGPVSDLAMRYEACRRMQVITKELAEALELELIDRMEEDVIPVPGVGQLVRRYDRKPRVKPSGTADFRRYVRQTLPNELTRDPETGEFDPVRRDAMREMANSLFDWMNLYPSSISAAGREPLHQEDYVEIVEVARVALRTEDEEG